MERYASDCITDLTRAWTGARSRQPVIMSCILMKHSVLHCYQTSSPQILPISNAITSFSCIALFSFLTIRPFYDLTIYYLCRSSPILFYFPCSLILPDLTASCLLLFPTPFPSYTPSSSSHLFPPSSQLHFLFSTHNSVR